MRDPVAAARGNPSYVWREGQERRMAMVRQWAPSDGAQQVLDVGCGVGMYTAAFTRWTPHVVGVEVELDRAREARQLGTMIVQAVGEALIGSRATIPSWVVEADDERAEVERQREHPQEGHHRHLLAELVGGRQQDE